MANKRLTISVNPDHCEYFSNQGLTPYAVGSQAFEAAALVEQNFRVPTSEIVSRMAELNYIVRTAGTITKTLTRHELLAIVDALNGAMITTDILFVEGWLLVQMEDAETYNGTITRQGANPATLLDKINQMDGVQMYAVYAIVREFWSAPAERRNLDRFLERYAMQP